MDPFQPHAGDEPLTSASQVTSWPAVHCAELAVTDHVFDGKAETSV
jgi:hypothetical protein